jgi:aminoglycoside phosphotransferase (APT) family kinase protein
MSRAPVAVLHDDLGTLPAVQAWAGMWAAQDAPERVEVLRRLPSSEVYRLVGAGPAGSSVIAKRSPAAKASVELIVYERLLPHLPVTAPRYYGSCPTDGPDGDRWIFLEDVGGERYSEATPTHVTMAARWVARMHGAAAGLAAARELPDGGPARYRAHVCGARDKIRPRLPGQDLTRDDVTMLQEVVAVLDALESRWGLIESLCGGLPTTLVHGDFRPKNVYLRPNGRGLACYPIDWETAGWGVPAADLTRIDVAAYWACARKWRAGLDLDTVQRLADVGQVFRSLAAIDWETASLRFESRRMVSRSLASLAVLLRRLSDAARTAGALE